jgi:hypothetical protein
MGNAATSLRAIAPNPPPGPITSAQILTLADSYDAQKDDTLALWNQFAGKTGGDFTALAADMVAAFRKTVSDIQRFWQEERADSNPLKAAGNEPPQPSQAAQAAVDSQINASVNETLNILQGSAQKMIPNVPDLPNAPDIGGVIWQFVKDHWVPIAVVVVGVGVGLRVVSLVGKTYLKVATGGLL